MDWAGFFAGIVAGVGSVAVASVGARSKLREMASAAQAERWSALDQPRHVAYRDLWKVTWALNRHDDELSRPSIPEISEYRESLLSWYGENGYLLTQASTRRWRRLVDACTPFLAKHGAGQSQDAEVLQGQMDEVVAVTFRESGIPGTSDFSWELPETVEAWSSCKTEGLPRDLVLLEVLASDLRASLARDLRARESTRDGEETAEKRFARLRRGLMGRHRKHPAERSSGVARAQTPPNA